MSSHGCRNHDHRDHRSPFLWGQCGADVVFYGRTDLYAACSQPKSFYSAITAHQTSFLVVFQIFGDYWKELNTESVYIIDSFPLPSCDTIQIKWSRRYRGEAYRSFIARKRRYFYGLRLPVMITPWGKPIEFFLTPGEDGDTGGMPWYQCEVPAGSTIIGDKGFNK